MGMGFECKVEEGRRRFVAEFCGTCFLAFGIATTGLSVFGGITISSILASMLLAFGPISGANLNPAVTFSQFLIGNLNIAESLLYMVAQCTGSMLGGIMALEVQHDSAYPAINRVEFGVGDSFATEMIFTAALCFVVLAMSTAEKNQNNMFFSVAIAGTVCSGIISVSRISGGCMNPAVGLLPILHGEYSDLVVYWTAPFVGSLWGVLMFTLIFPGDTLKCGLVSDQTRRAIATITIFNHPLPIIFSEFFGTMFLSFSVAFAAVGEPLAPFAISNMLLAFVYSVACVSGAHLNPAVTFAVFLRETLLDHLSRGSYNKMEDEGDGRNRAGSGAMVAMSEQADLFRKSLSLDEGAHNASTTKRPLRQADYERFVSMCVYIGAQMFGAFGAALVATAVMINEIHVGHPAIGKTYNDLEGFLAEFLGSIILVITVLCSGNSKHNKGNQFYGLLIGFSLGTLIQALGDVSGGAFNPAFGIALPSIVDSQAAKHEFIYFFGPMLGAVGGLFIYAFLYPEEVGMAARIDKPVEGVAERQLANPEDNSSL